MTQIALDWSADTSLPIAGRTPQARHASHSGAVVASQRRAALSLAYVQLLRELGACSDYEAARILGVGVSSVNSTRGGLGARVVADGTFETHTWATGAVSKRTRWRLT